MKKGIKAKLVDVTEYCVGPLLEMLQENFAVEWTEADPDFVIHSSFGHDVLRHEGVRVCWLGENLVPDFNISDYAMGFSRLSFGDRYRRVPLYRWYKEYEDLFDERRRVVSVSGEQALRDKSLFCTVVVTNGSNRDPYLADLMDAVCGYRLVSSGGKWRNNVGGPVEDKMAFVRQGKFALVCENSSTPGYVTEKILHAFAAHTVPVYWGASDVEADFNPEAFVNCHRCASFGEVVERIKWLDTHDDAYCRMLEQPCFAGAEEPAPLRKSEIQGWLASIFSQDRASAYRRNRLFWGKKYNRDLEIAFFEPHVQLMRRLKRLLK